MSVADSVFVGEASDREALMKAGLEDAPGFSVVAVQQDGQLVTNLRASM